MGLLITKASFTGKYAIATNAFDELEAYITKYEERYLVDLLGVTLFNLFKTDVTTGSPTNIPKATKYLAIYNAKKSDHNGCIIISEGVVEMLKGFIYFEYMRDIASKNTPSGTVVVKSENSTQAGSDTLYQRYNEGIDTYYAIQWYISENIDDYPDYNGQTKGWAHWSL